MPKGEQVNLQRTLTFVSFFYFTYSASKACLLPFLTLYLRQLGLSATQTGIIYGVKAFVALWAAPLWSSCATQYGRQRIVLMVAILMTIASNLGLTLLPPADEDLYFAFCNPGNNSNSENQGLINNSRTDDNGVSRTNFMQISMPSTVVYSTPLGNLLSTSVNSIHTPSTHRFTEPYQDNTIKTTTKLHSSKPVTRQFKPPEKFHHKPSHAVYPTAKTLNLHSPKPNVHKNSGLHQPSPKPIHFLPVSTSAQAEEPTHDDPAAQFQYNKGHFYNYDLVANSEWNGVTDTPHVNPWKPSQEEYSKPQAVEAEKHGPLADENIDKAESLLNWGNIHQQNSQNKGNNNQPNTRQNIPTSTTHFEEKSNPYDRHKRNDYNNIAKRSASSTEPDGISQNDQFPRSLWSAQESLSKTVTSFLEFEQLTFIIALLIVVIGESISCPVDKICDSSFHETLDAIDELDKYKRHNMPSIVGYGLFALIVTLIVDNTSCHIFRQASHFMIHFYLFAGLLGLTFLLAFFYPIPAPKKGSRKLRFCKGLKLLLGDPHNAIITLTMVITGALASNIHNFLFWHVQDLGGSEVVMGVAVLISVVSHIPMLFVTGWVTRKLSQTGILVVALLCLTVRLLYFTFLWTPWAVVPVEILCAFSQQALWETVTTYGEQISPPAMDRSIQSILNSLYHGLGFAIGSALGGLIYDQAGLQVLYGSSAGVALVWGMVVAVVARFVPKKKKQLHYSSLLRRQEEGDEEYLSDEDSDEVYGNDWLVKALKDDF